MPKSKKLQKQIEKVFDQLFKLLNQIDEVRVIQVDDPATWDSDTLSNLVANLKKTRQLLEDKKHPKAKDPWGEPLILEEGLCSLVDEYHEEAEENEEF